MKYLADSDWLIDILAGVPTASDLLIGLSDDGVAVSIVSYGELFEGAVRSRDEAAEMERIQTLLARFITLPLSDLIMARFARLRAGLRVRGLLIPDLDLLIAATALDGDLVLITRNLRHFERIPGLVIERHR